MKIVSIDLYRLAKSKTSYDKNDFSRCSERCKNSINILKRQRMAHKLAQCKCAEGERILEFGCQDIMDNMQTLCFPKVQIKEEEEEEEQTNTIESSSSKTLTPAVIVVIFVPILILTACNKNIF